MSKFSRGVAVAVMVVCSGCGIWSVAINKDWAAATFFLVCANEARRQLDHDNLMGPRS